MKKMLKIMAMLLVITTVIFAAGCAEKTETGNETGASEEVTDEIPVSEDGGNVSVVSVEEAPAEEAEVEENETNVTEDATVDVTEVPEEAEVEESETGVTEAPAEEEAAEEEANKTTTEE